MNLNKKMLKAVSLILALIMMGSVVAYAAKETDNTKQDNTEDTDEKVIGESTQKAEAGSAGIAPYKKTETVYVNLDSSGKPTQKNVTDWLHSDTPNAVLKDRTNLTEIENVKGEQKPEQNGNDVTWKMEGTDLYYRGKSDKELPVDVAISYSLDGKEMTAEKMAGLSGHMEMKIAVHNNLEKEVEMNGKKVTMYTPVMAAFAVAFPDDTFQNVTVSEGTVQSDGNNHAAAFVAIPGMNESLGLSTYDIPGVDQLDFPSEFTITADVTEFSMGPIGVLVSNDIPELDELDADEDIDSMIADLQSLKEAQNNLDLWDANGEIRSLFQNPELTGNAQTLVDDIFKFYDMDTSIMDILPRYITKKNIDLYDRIDKDMDDIDLDKLLDSQSVETLVNRLTRASIAKIRLLLNDYDKLQNLGSQKLEDLLDEAFAMIDKLDKNEEEIHTIEVLASYASQMMQMMDVLNDPQLQQMMEPATLKAAFTAIAKVQVEAAVQQKMGTTPTKLLQAESAMLSGSDISAYKQDLLAAVTVAKSQGALDEQQYAMLTGAINNYDAMKDKFIPSKIPNIPSLPTPQPPTTKTTVAGESDKTDAIAPEQQNPQQNQTDGATAQPTETEGNKNPGTSVNTPVDNGSSEGKDEGQKENETSDSDEQKDSTDAESKDENQESEQMGYGTSEDLRRESEGSYSDVDEQFENPGSDKTHQDTDGNAEDQKAEMPKENFDTAMQQPQLPQEDLDAAMQQPVAQTEVQAQQQPQTPPTLPPEMIQQLVKQLLENLQGKSVCQQILEVVDPVRVAMQGQVDAAAGQAADEIISQKVQPTLKNINQLKQNIVKDLGGNPQQAKEKLNRAKSFADEMVNALKHLIQQADQLEKGKDAEQLMREARDMIDHLEENKDNIAALQDFLDEWSDQDLEELRRNYPIMKKDFKEIRPILKDLQKDLDDPTVNESLHKSPDTVDDLMKIKDDIMDNREVSDIMKKTVDPNSVDHANKMFGIFDDLQAKGAIDKYSNQADDLDELTSRIDTYIDLVDDYRIYSDAADDAQTSTTFIMKTDEVKKPEKPRQEEVPVQEETGFLAWCKKIWHKLFGND